MHTLNESRKKKKTIQHINTDRERTILEKGVKIRNHQQFVTPLKGGSFIQATDINKE